MTMLNWWFKKGRQEDSIWIGFKPFKALIFLLLLLFYYFITFSGILGCCHRIWIAIRIFWAGIVPKSLFCYPGNATYWSGNAIHLCVFVCHPERLMLWRFGAMVGDSKACVTCLCRTKSRVLNVTTEWEWVGSKRRGNFFGFEKRQPLFTAKL